MKKFLLLTIGFEQPTDEIMAEWMKWFESIQEQIVQQVGLQNGKLVLREGVSDLKMDADALTGYLVITAKDMDEAHEIAKKCPMITSTKVYEMMENE